METGYGISFSDDVSLNLCRLPDTVRRFGTADMIAQMPEHPFREGYLDETVRAWNDFFCRFLPDADGSPTGADENAYAFVAQMIRLRLSQKYKVDAPVVYFGDCLYVPLLSLVPRTKAERAKKPVLAMLDDVFSGVLDGLLPPKDARPGVVDVWDD